MQKPRVVAPDTGLVPIGYISRAHGVRGEMGFVLTAGDPSLALGELFLRHRSGGEARRFVALGARAHHGGLLLRLQGIESRTDAELYKSHTVLVSRDRLPPLDEGEAFLADLPGLHVLVEGADGPVPLGVIERAEAPAGQLLWTIRTPDAREVLFPAVEEFVLSIDLDKGEALIDPPPGLLDIYLEA